MTGDGLTLDEVDAQDVTHYPLTLIVTPGETLTVGLRYRADHWSEHDASGILDRVVRLLTSRRGGSRRAARPRVDPLTA